MTAAARLSEHHQRRSLRPAEHRCLVLNADGNPLSTFPLSIIPAQDAVSAIWRDRASIVDTWEDAFFRSPSTTIAIPKVIMLREYAPISGEVKFCRRNILLRDRMACCYCGKRFPSPELTYDHVTPRSRGGKTVWENIVTACLRCNALKANSLPNYSGRKGKPSAGQMRPLRPPRRPSRAELLRAGLEFLPADIKDDFGGWLYWSAELQA
ncbi:MAG TPA: HNH endonuclease [Stellaceae bacterium]|nr:HNH endonuclease [Stellaceae bacterium]